LKKLKIIPDVVQAGGFETVSPSATVHQAAHRMAERDQGVLPVEDEVGNLVGVLTERDLARWMISAGNDPKQALVAQAMTARPDTLRPDDSATDALELMRIRGLTHIPVAGDDGKTVSIVSALDLCRAVSGEMDAMFQKAQSEVFDLPHEE